MRQHDVRAGFLSYAKIVNKNRIHVVYINISKNYKSAAIWFSAELHFPPKMHVLATCRHPIFWVESIDVSINSGLNISTFPIIVSMCVVAAYHVYATSNNH